MLVRDGRRRARAADGSRGTCVRPLAVGALALFVTACGGGPAPSGAADATLPPASAGPTVPAPATPAGAGSPPATTTAPPPGPSVSPDPATLLAAIATQTEAIRGLAPLAPIVPRFIDEAGLTRLLAADLDRDQGARRMADSEALLRGLGLFSGDRSLRDVYLEMLGSQVLGFYRQSDKTLYVVQRSGGLGPAESAIEAYTFSHELTHALQDQHFGIAGLGLDEVGQGDRTLARQALLEGDASYASTLWSQQHLSLADLLAILKVASDPAQQKLLADLPPIMRETMTFPYQDGLSFVLGLWTAGGWKAVDARVSRPARLHRADPPPGEVHGRREAGAR